MKKETKVRGVYEKTRGSGVWWILYYDSQGIRRRETVGTKSAAIKLYQKRKMEALQRKKLPENLRNTAKVADLAPLILRDYNINGKKSGYHVKFRLTKHLLPYFGAMAVDGLSSEQINSYIDKRKKDEAENATINRELAVLKRMVRLGRFTSPPMVNELPVFPPRLKENPPRQGFIEEEQYRKLQGNADEIWLRALIATAYSFAFRKGEILLNLRVRQLNLHTGTIRLQAGETKNDEGRVVRMVSEVRGLLSKCIDGKQPDDYVFTRDGQPVKDFRETWYKLCEKAGLGKIVKVKDRRGKYRTKYHGLHFHDLRRSGARNMRRYGVDEGVIMKIGGWKTRSVFQRYNIVSENDLVEAAQKIERGRELDAAIREKPTATTTATSSKPDHKQQAAFAG